MTLRAGQVRKRLPSVEHYWLLREALVTIWRPFAFSFHLTRPLSVEARSNTSARYTTDRIVVSGTSINRRDETLSLSSSNVHPRHSRRMTHLCSDRVTHTKNRPCPWARSEQAISSTPKACKVFGSAGPSRQLPVCTGPAREQYTTQLSVVVGHFWRAKYGHFSRVPKRHGDGDRFIEAIGLHIDTVNKAIGIGKRDSAAGGGHATHYTTTFAFCSP